MRKNFLLYSLLMLALVPACFAGTSNITGTIQDPNGQVFANGTVTATFVPNPNSPSANYTTTGGVSFPQTVTGTLNGSGVFNITITDSLTISPALSQWNITVCPKASSQCSQYIASITGAAPNLSAAINAVTPAIVVQPSTFAMPFAYQDAEIAGPIVGTVYYNTTISNARIYNGASWSTLAGGISSAWASGGVSAGVLCKSNGAGLCLDSSITDTGTLVQNTLQVLVPAGTITSPSVQWAEATANSGWFRSGANNYDFSIGNSTVVMRLNGTATVVKAIQFSTNPNATAADLFLARRGAANLQLGNSDINGSPIAQNLSMQNAITGSNLAGSDFTLFGSNGTGSGGGGQLLFKTGVPHGSDSIADTFTTAMTMDKNQLVTANVSFTSPHVNATTDFSLAGSVAQVGMQGSTGTKIFSCTGSFTSGNFVKTDANGNCVDGGSTSSAVTKEFGTVTAASQSGTAATTYFLNSNSIASAEWVAGAKFTFEGLSKWVNNDSSLAKTATSGIGIDGTQRGTCSHGSVTSGATGFAYDRITVFVMTTGAGGTMLITNECISGNNANTIETTSITTVAIDTTVSHAITAAINVPAVDTSSTGTNLYLMGTRTF